MNTGIEFTMKLSAAYSAVCRPLCHELNLPQTAFDILMFLANNPEYTTARDIVEIRKIKANLVSINVDKLVGEGYLLREADTDDRRKTHLLCTDKAGAVIEQGRALRTALWTVSWRISMMLPENKLTEKHPSDGAKSGSHVRGGTLI